MSGEFQGRQSFMNQVGAGVQSLIRQDQYANIVVSQSLPKYADLALSNKLFIAAQATTSIAPATAPLTTSAQHLLYNSSSTKRLVVIRAWVALESGTRAIGSSLWGCITQAAEATAPAAATGVVSKGLGHTATAAGLYDTAVTLDATEAWFMLAAKDTLADANESSGMLVADLDGLVVVPPLRSFGMSVRDSAAGTTPLYSGGFIWAELALDAA